MYVLRVCTLRLEYYKKTFCRELHVRPSVANTMFFLFPPPFPDRLFSFIKILVYGDDKIETNNFHTVRVMRWILKFIIFFFSFSTSAENRIFFSPVRREYREIFVYDIFRPIQKPAEKYSL